MRDIKFRAWDKVGGFMVGVGAIDFENKKLRICNCTEWWPLDNYILMQYTGLRDKEGKEIFEGDVVEGRNKKKFIILFSERDFAFKLKTFPQMWLGREWTMTEEYYFGKYRTFSKYTDGTNPLDFLKIIGNVHENKLEELK